MAYNKEAVAELKALWKRRLERWRAWWSVYDVYAIVVMLLVGALGYRLMKNATVMGDIEFLIKRYLSFCIETKSGRTPYFYNDSCYGLGYGSPFFYGQLPFYICHLLRLNADGMHIFHHLVPSVLVYIGTRMFAERFNVKNARFIAFTLAFSGYWFSQYMFSTMVSCDLAMAVGIFFLCFCVDFFRDGKSLFKSAVMFWVVFNIHTITATVLVVCAFVIMCYYFSVKRIKGYFQYLIAHGLVSIYNVLNIYYHLRENSALNSIKNSIMNDPVLSDNACMVRLSPRVVGYDSTHYVLFNLSFAIVVLVFLIIGFKKRTFNKKQIAFLILCTGVTIASIYPMYLYLMAWFWGQFSYRYMYFVSMPLAIVILRNVDIKKWVKVIVIAEGAFYYVMLFVVMSAPSVSLTEAQEVASFMLDDKDDRYTNDTTYRYIGNGEYLSMEYRLHQGDLADYWNEHFGEVEVNGTEYIKADMGIRGYDGESYYKGYELLETDRNVTSTGVLVVEGDFHTGDVLVFPKFYFKGYLCTAGEVTAGKYDLIQVVCDSDCSEIKLWYSQPLGLRICEYFSVIVVFAFACCIRDKRDDTGSEIKCEVVENTQNS